MEEDDLKSFIMSVFCKRDIGNHCWKKDTYYSILLKDCSFVRKGSFTASAIGTQEHIACRFDSLESFLDTFEF